MNNKTTDEEWKKFFGVGWYYDKIPSKRDCFEAGFKAAMNHIKNQARRVVADGAIDLEKISNTPGAINYVPKKKTTYEIIKEWEDKFEAEKK